MMWLVVLICIGIVFENVKFGNARDFAVRLNSFYWIDSAEGRLEIFYNGSWGTVCDDYFTNASARVACASLGFSYKGSVIPNGGRYYDYDYDYDYGTSPIWLSEVNCTGTESGIDKCSRNGWGANNCSHHNDVLIRCDCGIRNFSGPTGQISSPNFPEQYVNGLDCYNYIAVLSRETIIVTFLVLNTENNYDWVKITCESGNASRSTSFSGSQLPPVLTLSSCNLLNVHFHSNNYRTKTGFSLNYNVTTENVTGGITTRPSNVSSRLDTDRIMFNCTSASEYIPWWTWAPDNSIMTNSTCGVIRSTPYSSRFLAESLGPGSCNLIMVASDDYPYLLVGSLVCSDSTLSSATAIIPPIDCVIKNLSGPTGRISSPKFPLRYANNQRRCNYITAPAGHTIVITFLSFNIGYRDFIRITCENGTAYRTSVYSGILFPAVLTISSCNLLNVYFHSNYSEYMYYYRNAFSLTFNMTSDIVIGGFTTKPSNAFPRSGDLIIFNCTTTSKYFPWWTIDFKRSTYMPYYITSAKITNSSCEVVTSAPERSWFMTETLGPGSCNLIVSAPANSFFRLRGVVTCTDSTLSSARAILAPVDLVLKKTKIHNLLATSNDAIRTEVTRISCTSSFVDEHSSSSLVFTYQRYNEGLLVQMRIVRTYWTSEGKVVPSVYTSDSSSYVIVQDPKDSVIPRYTCHIVCDFFSNMTDLTANTTIEIYFSSDLDGVFIVEYQNVSVVILLGVAVVALIILVFILLIRICRQQANNLVADAGSGPTRRSNEYELQQRGGESNPYEAVFGTDVDVVGSDYYKLDAMGRRLPAIPQMYDELEHNDTGNDGIQSAESNHYEAGLGADIDVHESEYDNIDDSPQRLPSLSGIYDELEFDK